MADAQVPIDDDLDAREREYSPSSCIGGNYQPFIDAYASRSQAARRKTAGNLNLRYGAQPAQRLDLFVPPRPLSHQASPLPPLLVFIHGGYWQELSKEESAFAASDCVQQGMAFAALDYTLAPQASVAEMVVECRMALAWLHQHAATLGFDANRIVVAGSSAGAHLAAMAALPDSGEVGVPVPWKVKALVLVSGIYELEPLVGTSINAAVGLTLATAREASPALHPLAGFPPSIVCWGEVETMAFKQQSQHFAQRLLQAGARCQTFEVPGRNHFDIILDLADPNTPLGRSTAALLQSV